MFILGFLAGINIGLVIQSLAELICVCIENRREKRAENSRILSEIRDSISRLAEQNKAGCDSDGDKSRYFFGGKADSLEDITYTYGADTDGDNK